MKMKMITKAIALTLCASMIMGTPTENFAKAQGSAAETKQDEKKDRKPTSFDIGFTSLGLVPSFCWRDHFRMPK